MQIRKRILPLGTDQESSKLVIMSTKKSSQLTDTYLARLRIGAREQTQQNARELRQRQTQAEEKLWSLLRNRQLNGKKFRRQHAMADFVADFYCNECKLALELDGNAHVNTESKENDRSRSASLNQLGITVLRFWNYEVLKNPDQVLKKIADYLT
jgi:very-short-patch-repair endonuclease